jgi:hypothetical protein
MEERKIKEELFREIKRRGLMEQEDDDEVGEPKKNDFCEMVCKILHSRNQSHIFHLQTKSYSEHKALNDYYDNIVDLYDGLIESYQGKELLFSTLYKLKFLN